MSFNIVISNAQKEYQCYASQIRPKLAQAQLLAKQQEKDEFKAQVVNLLETIHDGHISLNLQEQLDSCKKIFESLKDHQNPGCFFLLDRIIAYYTFERPVQQMIDKIAASIPKAVEMRVIVHQPVEEKPADNRTVGQIAYDELRSQILKTKDSELFADIINMPRPKTETNNIFSSLFGKFVLMNN